MCVCVCYFSDVFLPFANASKIGKRQNKPCPDQQSEGLNWLTRRSEEEERASKDQIRYSKKLVSL